MGLATIDPHSLKFTPSATKSPALVLIDPILSEILTMSKFTKKCMAIRMQRPDGHTFLYKF